MKRALVAAGVCGLVAAFGLIGLPRPPVDPAWRWDLPPGFPAPAVPTNNPMSVEKVALGRRLFYDKRLSGNQTMSCATCHDQQRAFSDGRQHAVGSTGVVHRRNTMALVNVAYVSPLTWANPHLALLEDQALMPMLGDNPVEMGLSGGELVVERLSSDAATAAAFSRAFPGSDPPVTLEHVVQAIACFERTLISGRSPYDRFVGGDRGALTDSAARGLELFLSERLECFHCHGGFNFTDSFGHAGMAEAERRFHNTALYNLDGQGAYPERDRGLHDITSDASDMGKFRAPTLRNIAVTAPYMHDGSVATLTEVISHYEAGGRTVTAPPDAGDGSTSPIKDRFLQGFVLTDSERADLVAFLESLTDSDFLSDPRFSDPGP